MPEHARQLQMSGENWRQMPAGPKIQSGNEDMRRCRIDLFLPSLNCFPAFLCTQINFANQSNFLVLYQTSTSVNWIRTHAMTATNVSTLSGRSNAFS